MLKRRDEVMTDFIEAKKTLSAQVEELTQSQTQREIHLKRVKDQHKSMETRYGESLAQMKSALARISSLEQQLSQSQNECISLKERAAVAFDELTPRPDWQLAGIPQTDADQRRSSKDCFNELLRLVHERKAANAGHRKTRKMLSPPPPG